MRQQFHNQAFSNKKRVKTLYFRAIWTFFGKKMLHDLSFPAPLSMFTPKS